MYKIQNGWVSVELKLKNVCVIRSTTSKGGFRILYISFISLNINPYATELNHLSNVFVEWAKHVSFAHTIPYRSMSQNKFFTWIIYARFPCANCSFLIQPFRQRYTYTQNGVYSLHNLALSGMYIVHKHIYIWRIKSRYIPREWINIFIFPSMNNNESKNKDTFVVYLFL